MVSISPRPSTTSNPAATASPRSTPARWIRWIRPRLIPARARPMPRPAYTARAREALLMYRNADGTLEVGKGRLRIAPGAISYFGRVTMALAHVLDLPDGPEVFARGDELGHAV